MLIVGRKLPSLLLDFVDQFYLMKIMDKMDVMGPRVFFFSIIVTVIRVA